MTNKISAIIDKRTVLIGSAFLILLSLFFFSADVSAQGTYSCSYSSVNGCIVVNECDEGYLPGTCSGGDIASCITGAEECVSEIGLAERVGNFYQWALGIGALVALGIIVFGGLRYTMSAGNPSRIDDAKKWIWGALAGLLLLFGSFLILSTINPNLVTLSDPEIDTNEGSYFSDLPERFREAFIEARDRYIEDETTEPDTTEPEGDDETPSPIPDPTPSSGYAMLSFTSTSPGKREYDGAALANVADGLSGMWVSRRNPNIHWFIVDHTGKTSGDWTVFAIDSVNDKLVWRGKFSSGVSWKDVEDLSGYEKAGNYYLTIWNNNNDTVYEFKEPSISTGQSLVSESSITLYRKVTISGMDGNIEGMAYSQPEDSMYWIGPRGGDSENHDNKKNVWRVSSWTSIPNGSTVSASHSGGVVARPRDTDVPNSVGALDISPDGNVFVVQGVGGTSSDGNSWAMPFTKKSSQTWKDRFRELESVSSKLRQSDCFRFSRPGENVALHPSMNKLFSAAEGTPGGAWGEIFSASFDYTP